ncbi:MAG: hypothetical protein NVSMB66_3720 [Candidatus Doudnabacteria bacterium]
MNQSIGKRGEAIALSIYKERGYGLLESNYYNKNGRRVGEIDLIVSKTQQKEIRFIEVKTRTSGSFGAGEEAISRSKKTKLLKAVRYFFYNNPELLSFNPQIDAVIMEISSFDKSLQKVKIYADVIVDYY